VIVASLQSGNPLNSDPPIEDVSWQYGFIYPSFPVTNSIRGTWVLRPLIITFGYYSPLASYVFLPPKRSAVRYVHDLHRNGVNFRSYCMRLAFDIFSCQRGSGVFRMMSVKDGLRITQIGGATESFALRPTSRISKKTREWHEWCKPAYFYSGG